jgi:type IV secretion system protein VirB1
MVFDISAYVQDCSPPQYADLMRRIVGVESAGNPFSIGVVRARLARQPVNLSEAVATAKSLKALKYDFSIGLAQVNQIHFPRLGWSHQLAEGFNACKNISAGAEILDICFAKASQYESQSGKNVGSLSVRKMALSCYYSGDLFLGERLGYVTKVIGHSPTDNIHQSPKLTTMDYSYENK